MLLVLVLLILGVGGESVPDILRERIIKKERIQDIPKLSEWNYEDPEFQRHLIVQGGKPKQLLLTTESASEVGGMLAEVCRRCMVVMDIDCISSLCMLQKQRIDVEISVPATTDVEHHAFATGTSQHADILCSLCKHTRDVMCTMKLCENPDRDKYIENGGVECQQGFCRWQKVSVSGYNNYYQGWWQPQGWILWFEELTKHLAGAYREIHEVTHHAMRLLYG